MALHPLADFPFHRQQCELVIKGDEKATADFIEVEEASEVLPPGERAHYPLDGELVLDIPESQDLDGKW